MSRPPVQGSSTPVVSPETPRRTENLALIFQELLTAIVRLRAQRRAAVRADVLRNQVRQAIKAAEQSGRRVGYTDDDIRLAVFAVVAFLDESILNLRDPIFNEWVRKPLQEEIFGRHTAGEIFFENLDKLIGRRDSQDNADLLEVHYLCLLLGFGGRYSVSGRGELRAIMGSLADKIDRIRKSSAEFSPRWAPPRELFRSVVNRWTKWMAVAAASAVITVLVLFSGYRLSLDSGISNVRTEAAQTPR